MVRQNPEVLVDFQGCIKAAVVVQRQVVAVDILDVKPQVGRALPGVGD